MLDWLRGRLGARRGEVAEVPRAEPQFRASSPENPSTNLADPASWLFGAFGAGAGDFGPPVSERTAMACSAVFRCVALLSGIIASLPLKVYQRTADGRVEVPDHPLAQFFKVAPYPTQPGYATGQPMTAFIWRELWGVNEFLHGNHYSARRYNREGQTIGFEAAEPQNVEVRRWQGRNKYRFVWPYGSSLNSTLSAVEWLDQDDVIHIPGVGFNGIAGMSRIRANARDSVALSRMLLEQIGRVHENAARPSGFVEVPPTISEAGFKRMRAEFEGQYVGRVNAGRVIFGDMGSKFTSFQITPEDLNTIELMRFTVSDVSRFFGVPLFLLNETDKSTSWGTGLSEQSLAMLIYTVNPDLERIEGELNYKLFDGGGNFYAEFDRRGLLAMAPLVAAQVAQTEVSFGGLLVNEYRKLNNRPPVQFGNQPMMNATNQPLSKMFTPGAQPRTDPIDPNAPGPTQQPRRT